MPASGGDRTVSYLLGHTYEFEPQLLDRTRALLDVVFDGDFADVDWEHSIGGVHAIALEDDEPIGHAAVIQRRLITAGRALRVGYVEGVGVRPDRQRCGIGGEMMATLEHIIATAYDIGALGASDDAIPMYTGRGWVAWRGPLSALTPDGIVATPDEAGAVFVLAGTSPLDGDIDLEGELTCDWRDGDVW